MRLISRRGKSDDIIEILDSDSSNDVPLWSLDRNQQPTGHRANEENALGDVLKCQYCGVTATGDNRVWLAKHILLMHSGYDIDHFRSVYFECSNCFKSILRKQSIIMHVFFCQNGKAQGFVSYSKYENNLKEQCHECLSCGLVQNYMHMAKAHVKLQHPNSVPLNDCLVCGTDCQSITDMQIHYIATHVVTALHACGECNYSSMNLQKVQSHFDIQHSKCSKFLCQMCLYEEQMTYFCTKMNLNRHVTLKHNKASSLKYKKDDIAENNQPTNLKGKVVPCHKLWPQKQSSVISAYMSQLEITHTDIAAEVLENRVCPVCKKHCNTIPEVKRHYLSMHITRPYVYNCGYCLSYFSHEKELQRHFRLEHEYPSKGNLLQCFGCVRDLEKFVFFPHESLLQFHEEYVHENIDKDENLAKAVSCSLCSVVFRNARCCRAHLIYCHCGTMEMICCNQKFRDWIGLSNHAMSCHMLNSVFVCGTCGESFLEYTNITNHFLRAHFTAIREDLGCSFCTTIIMKFSDPVFCRAHIASQHGGQFLKWERRKFRCSDCNCRYLTSRELDVHMKTRHFCFCGEKFANMYHLQRHVNARHNVNELFICGDCEKWFKSRQSLSKHVSLVHRESLNYQACCSFCKSSTEFFSIFFKYDNLMKHIDLCQRGDSKDISLRSTEDAVEECHEDVLTRNEDLIPDNVILLVEDEESEES